MIIVVAWLVQDFEVVRHRRADLGERPEMREVSRPAAAVWLLRGTQEDLEKAQKYTTSLDPVATVYQYPTTERDPLGRAKRDVLNDE